MNRLLTTAVLALIVAAACTKTVETDPYAPGVCVAECIVGAEEGSVSILVETEGTWHIASCAPWIQSDVDGGSGRGAFTLHYESNESDILHIRSGREGTIAILLDGSDKADSLRLVQQGFLSRISPRETGSDPAMKLEFETPTLSTKTLLVINTEGIAEASEWADGKADVVVKDGSITGDCGVILVVGCDLSALDAKTAYEAFRIAVDGGVFAAGQAGWILCGTMNHYSMMQTGYPDTPSWYPKDAKGEEFRSDRYAWQNNLYDLLWMKQRGFVTTFTDGDGHKWEADYLYVSTRVLSKVTEVEIMNIPVGGMSHHPLRLTLNY